MNTDGGASAGGAAESASTEETAEKSDENAAEKSAGDEASETAEPVEAVKVESFDADGLPLDREATIDDVRSRTGLHGRFALGCALLVVLLIAAFWLIRAGMVG